MSNTSDEDAFDAVNSLLMQDAKDAGIKPSEIMRGGLFGFGESTPQMPNTTPEPFSLPPPTPPAPYSAPPVQGGRAKTMRNSTSGGDIVSSMLTIRNQVKLYHWQTGSFARHKATDDLTAALDASIDTFVEVFMGKYGRPKVSKSIKLHNFSDQAARSFVAKQAVFLTKVLPRKLKRTDTDLLNVRDEILAELNKVLYLFTLQ